MNYDSIIEKVSGKLNNDDLFALFAKLTVDELKFVSRFPIEVAAINKKDKEKYARLLSLLDEGKFLPFRTGVCSLAYKEALAREAPAVYNEYDLHASAHGHGDAIFHTTSSLVVQKASGDIVEVKNSLIPDPNGAKRPGLLSIVFAVSALIKVEKGVIVHSYDEREFNKSWDRKTVPFYPERSLDVVNTFARIVELQPDFMKIAADKTTLSKGFLLSFIKQSFLRMDNILYYYFHTYFVHEYLQIFVPDEKRNAPFAYTTKRYKVGGELRVPDSSYTVITSDIEKEVVSAIRKRKYREVLLFIGGIPNTVHFNASGTLQAAIRSRQRSICVRGSDKTALSFVSSGYGYGGITTPATRRIMRAVSMACAALALSLSVDIQLYKANDLQLIFSSLKKHFPKGDWKIIIPYENQDNISITFRNSVCPSGREGSHLIVYNAKGMNSYSTKEKDGNSDYVELSLNHYKADSAKWAPRPIHSGYTIFTSIYGDYPWKRPVTGDGKKSVDNHFYSSPDPEKVHYVYRLGFGDQFHGIVSTIKDLALYGLEAKIVNPDLPDSALPSPSDTTGGSLADTRKTSADKTVDLRENNDYVEVEKEERRLVVLEPKAVPLRLYATEAEWYNWVIASNAMREGYWCTAKPVYSPICNVIVPHRSGVEVSSKLYEDDFSEQDTGKHIVEEETVEDDFDEEFLSEIPDQVNEDAYDAQETEDGSEDVQDDRISSAMAGIPVRTPKASGKSLEDYND